MSIEKIASDVAGFGGHLECTKCGRVQDLGEITDHLKTGWPKCCSLTMTWLTQRQLDERAASRLTPEHELTCARTMDLRIRVEQ